jgi:hypothetical protein
MRSVLDGRTCLIYFVKNRKGRIHLSQLMTIHVGLIGRGNISAQNIEELWNGHFYIQKVTPVGEIRPMPPYDKEDWKERVVRDGRLKYHFSQKG